MQKEKPIVAHLVRDYLNLSESWIFNQINSQKNFDSIVLCRNRKHPNHFKLKPIYKYPLWSDGFTSATGSDLLKRKILAGGQRIKDTFSKAEEQFYIQKIKQEQAQLIHIHYGTTAWEFRSLKQKTGLPLVASFYGADAYWTPSNFKFWRQRYLDLFEIVDALIVKGPAMKKQLVKLGCEANKIHIIDHGVDVESISFKARKKKDSVRFLMASRLVQFKGIDVALKAFSLIEKKYSKVELIVVGSGPEEEKLQSLAKQLDLKRVTFKSFMPYKKLITFVETCDVFIQSSIERNGSKEGNPTSMLERMSAGMLIIASEHSDIPFAITHKKTGLLFPEGDHQALAHRIEYLLEHPEVWEGLTQNARKKIETDFNLVQQTEKRQLLYQDIIRLR